MKVSANTKKLIQTICFKCMRIRKSGIVCDHCGYNYHRYETHPQFLEPGTILKEKYLLGIPLGNDGFNNTYMAFDISLNQRVVVREYYPVGLASRGVDRHHVRPNTDESQNELFIFGKRAFLKESMTLSDIRMQHIVPVLNYFSENNTGYLVTSYVEGIDLERHLSIRGGKLSIRESIEIILPILTTLHKLHKKNIFHYNLSLSKIMFVHQGHPVILGFAQAKQIIDKQSEKFRKTVKYTEAPPEQYDPKGKLGAWSDVYCCGILLYKMITGKTPPKSVERLKRDEWIPANRIHGIKVSQELSDVIDSSVAININNRYNTTREFYHAIKSKTPKRPKTPGKTFFFVIILLLFIMGSFGLKKFYFEKQNNQESKTVQHVYVMDKSSQAKKNPVPPKTKKIIPSIKTDTTTSKLDSKINNITYNAPNKKDITKTVSIQEEKIKAEILLRLCGNQEFCDILTQKLVEGFLTDAKYNNISKEITENNIIQIKAKKEDKTYQVNIEPVETNIAFEWLPYDKCDLLFSGKKINPKNSPDTDIYEAEQTESSHLIALDGIVFLVNSDNPVRSLNITEVKDIFSGLIKKWKKVGGKSGEINIYTPESSSDLYQFVQKHVLEDKKIKFHKKYKHIKKLSKSLEKDPNGIAFCSLPFIGNNQALAIADNEIDSIRPSYFSVSTDEYILIRKLYMYTILVSASQSTLPFVSFIQSSKGQALIKQSGYVDCEVKSLGSRRELWQKPVNPAVFRKIVKITKNTKKLSMNFYFENNKHELVSDSYQKFKQLTSWLKQQTDVKKIYAIGFSDSIGSYRHNCLVALKRAEMVAKEMRISGIYVDEIVTACEEFPIASNQTEKGRNKNRRVEIWIEH